MKPRTGATLIELLLVIAFVGVGVAVANIAGTKYGLLGYIGGFIAGTVGGCVAFFAFGFTMAYTIGIFTGIPTDPECSNSRCRDGEWPQSDYRLEDNDGRVVARCKCGIPYAKQGRRVFQLHADGSQTPYMIWKPFGGWFRDEVHR